MEQSLMERFADPALNADMSMGEKMLGGTVTLVMGMGITFIVLIMLWGIIALMARALNKTGSSQKDTSAQIPTPQAAAPAVKVTDEKGEAVTDGELIAVIAAATVAYESGDAVQSNNLVIRKINRATGRSTAWSRAGAQATIEGRNI